MVNPSETNFDAIEQLLRSVGALGEAPEIHGDLCGQVCLMGEEAGGPWVSEVLAETNAPEAGRMLQSLAAQAWQSLDEGDMSFTLLLPADDAALELRADSLGLWCQGFVHGMGTAGGQGDKGAVFEQGVAHDVIEDFSQIARAAFAEDESAEQAEAAYMELVEYVRVSVQLIFEEFRPLRDSSAGQGTH